MPPLSLSLQHPHPVRDRLWLAGFGVALFLVTLVVGTEIANPGTSLVRGARGDDFLPSYMAGSFVRDGRPERLMDFREAVRFQSHTRRVAGLEQHGRTGPWLNPPFFAWLFVPLAALPYTTALGVWLAFNLLCLGVSIVLLCRMLPRRTDDERSWRSWALVPLLVICSMPLLQAMACQQNTFLSLLLLTATVTLWRSGRALPAGLVAGLLMFKPQLGALVALALALSLGRRAVLGLAITGASLLLVTVLTMPGALGDYLAKLPALVPSAQMHRPYAWERQVTLQGFWRLLIEGRVGGPATWAVRVLWLTSAAAVAASLLPVGVRAIRAPRVGGTAPSPDRLITAAVTAMPLLMPYYMDYDLLLLAVPAVLFAADICRSGGSLRPLDRCLLGGWAVLYAWLFFNAAAASTYRVSLTVVLLAALAVMLAFRAAGAGEQAAETRDDEPVTQTPPAPLSVAA